jgi:K+-transporting ATPase A subunit
VPVDGRRTLKYLGKKIEAREMKLVMLSFEGVRGFRNPQIAPMTAEYRASLGANHPTGLPIF